VNGEVDTLRINFYTWFGATFGRRNARRMGIDHNLYLISMAARMLGMHPQTLRKYERLGLVRPSRTIGSMRLYSRDELERLKVIKRLVDDGGINLAGVQRLLSIAEVVQRIRPLMRDETLSARDARRRLGQELDALIRILDVD
jgi:MerR family transcriptional regulator, heat shock protein HspR